MKIAIDIDDTLADFSPMFLKFYNKKFNTSFKVSDFARLDWWNVLNIERGDILSVVYDFYKSDEFMDIVPVVGAVGAVEKLAKKHDLISVTARSKKVEKITNKWIENHFAANIEKIFMTDLHLFKKNKMSKGKICHDEGVDILIDDLPKFNTECHDNGIKTLLFDTPWNQEVENDKYLQRVKSWKEVVGFIGKM